MWAYLGGVYPWLGSHEVPSFWITLTAGLLAVLGGFVAINPPEKSMFWLKLFYVVSFAVLASVGTRAELQLRAREERNRQNYEQAQRDAQTQQTNAEIRFSKDLAAVKDSSDAILRFVANPPKGITEKQFASTLSELLRTRDQIAVNVNGAPTQTPAQGPVSTADQTKALKDITSAWTKLANDWVDSKLRDPAAAIETSGAPATAAEFQKHQKFEEQSQMEWNASYGPIARIFLAQYQLLNLAPRNINACSGIDIGGGYLQTYKRCVVDIQEAASKLN